MLGKGSKTKSKMYGNPTSECSQVRPCILPVTSQMQKVREPKNQLGKFSQIGAGGELWHHVMTSCQRSQDGGNRRENFKAVLIIWTKYLESSFEVRNGEGFLINFSFRLHKNKSLLRLQFYVPVEFFKLSFLHVPGPALC